MYWILRRTGAANFFNSLNNNAGTSKANYNVNNNNERNVKRPERKAYGRLSVDSDDVLSIQTKIETLNSSDNEFDELKMKKSKTFQNTPNNFQENILEEKMTLDFNSNDSLVWKNIKKSNVNDKSKEIDEQDKSNEEGEPKNLIGNDENYINRLQPIPTVSDDEDNDEALTCNVCDRAFHSLSQLASHQQKKRHFGCSECDSLFTSLMLLEHHKDEFEHWSDYDESQIPCCRRNRTEDFGDTDSFTSEAASEDLERLL